MIKCIEIKNFQSHKNTTLELHENINVIYGLSDSGKSAFIRSIDCVLRRTPFYIRINSDDGFSKISFDDREISRTVKRTKTTKCPTCKTKLDYKEQQVCESCGELIPTNTSEDYYMIDDEKHEKFGAVLPEHINSFTRMNPIKFIDTDIFINLSKQHDDFFFIGREYDNIRNKMISALITDSDSVDNLIKTLNSEKYSKSEQNRLFKKELESTDKLLSESEQLYTDCIQLSDEIECLEKEIELESKQQSELIKIASQIERLDKSLNASQDSVKLGLKITKSIEICDKMTNVSKKVNHLKKIQNSLTMLSKYANIDKLEFDNDIPDNLITLISIRNNMKDLNERRIKLDALSKFKDVKITFPDVSILNELISLNAAHSKQKTYYDDFMVMSAIITTTTDKLRKCDNEIIKVKEEIAENTKGLCPITNQPYCESCVKVLKNGLS